jgi:hypothetical protein
MLFGNRRSQTMSVTPEQGNQATPPNQEIRSQCGCGDDAEQTAVHELAEAKAHEAEADSEMKHALHDAEAAEREREKAEADLEEARRHPHEIHFEVDGDPYTTEQRVWTPNEIIRKFGERDPAANYLVRIEGDHTISFQDKGDIPIELHDCERFQIIAIGPTPVSDGTKLTGVAAFNAGLSALGYSPTIVAGTTDHVAFDYMVQTGKYAGTQFRLGFAVPPDFPLTAPSGPHVSPRIHPNSSVQSHPTGAISDSGTFQGKAGGDWHYWSRPFKAWGQSKKTAAAYMSYISHLWDTQ